MSFTFLNPIERKLLRKEKHMKNSTAFMTQFDAVVAEAEKLKPLAAAATAITHPPATAEDETKLAGIIDQMLAIYPSVHSHLKTLRGMLAK